MRLTSAWSGRRRTVSQGRATTRKIALIFRRGRAWLAPLPKARKVGPAQQMELSPRSGGCAGVARAKGLLLAEAACPPWPDALRTELTLSEQRSGGSQVSTPIRKACDSNNELAGARVQSESSLSALRPLIPLRPVVREEEGDANPARELGREPPGFGLITSGGSMVSWASPLGRSWTCRIESS